MSGFFSQLKKTSPPQTPDNGPFGAAGEFRDLEDPRILYRLSKRASRISLKVRTSEREVAVIVPSIRALKKAQAFARENQEWINVQLESLPAPQPFVAGEDNDSRAALPPYQPRRARASANKSSSARGHCTRP